MVETRAPAAVASASTAVSSASVFPQLPDIPPPPEFPDTNQQLSIQPPQTGLETLLTPMVAVTTLGKHGNDYLFSSCRLSLSLNSRQVDCALGY